jgi:hypothetical protein
VLVASQSAGRGNPSTLRNTQGNYVKGSVAPLPTLGVTIPTPALTLSGYSAGDVAIAEAGMVFAFQICPLSGCGPALSTPVSTSATVSASGIASGAFFGTSGGEIYAEYQLSISPNNPGSIINAYTSPGRTNLDQANSTSTRPSHSPSTHHTMCQCQRLEPPIPEVPFLPRLIP